MNKEIWTPAKRKAHGEMIRQRIAARRAAQGQRMTEHAEFHRRLSDHVYGAVTRRDIVALRLVGMLEVALASGSIADEAKQTAAPLIAEFYAATVTNGATN